LFLTSSSFITDFVNCVLPWFCEFFFVVDLYLVPFTFFCDIWQFQGQEKGHFQMLMMNMWFKLCKRNWKWRTDPFLETTTLHNIFLKLSQGMHAFDLFFTYNMSSISITCVGRFSKSKNLVNMLNSKIHRFWTLLLPMINVLRYG
jgi:hypothetical protein